MNNRYKWLPHPVVLFVFSMTALAATLFLCIFWYIEVKSGLEELIGRLNFDPLLVFQSRTWVVILIITLLGSVIISGIFMTFVYYQKVLQLYSHQQSFINNFTHELKTPVTSLKLYLETFLKHDLTKQDQRKYLRYMLSDVSRLSENINGILDLGRLENDEYDCKLFPLDIVSTTQKFLKINAYLFTNAEITFKNHLNQPVILKIDIMLFEMLLMNIMTNAIKYNESGACTIDISFARVRNNLIVRFRDNGIGIEKKEETAIFRKFHQASSSGKMASGGSGLGLYLVSMIARLHGGNIVAKSHGMGNGCEFIMTLPCSDTVGTNNKEKKRITGNGNDDKFR